MKSKTWKLLPLLSLTVLALAVVSACGSASVETEHEYRVPDPVMSSAEPLEPVSLETGEKLRVVATTNIVGDVVSQVAGDKIELVTLMGIGVDPHTYVATPSDTAAIHDAHVVFANGAGLESDLEEMFKAAGGEAIHVQVSYGLEFLASSDEHREATKAGGERDNGDVDPHVWFNVQNVIHWVETIEQTLTALDQL